MIIVCCVRPNDFELDLYHNQYNGKRYDSHSNSHSNSHSYSHIKIREFNLFKEIHMKPATAKTKSQKKVIMEKQAERSLIIALGRSFVS